MEGHQPIAMDILALKPSPHRRRWLQISLRTLLVGITLVAVFLGVVVNGILLPAQQQREAVKELAKWSWTLGYEERPKEVPWWETGARRVLPQEFFETVTEVSMSHLSSFPLTDGERLVHMCGVGMRPTADLAGDAALVHLRPLHGLERLDLSDTHITDSGLANIAALTKLEQLDLGYTHVGDAGMSHLSRLTNLEAIFLDRTQVSDLGLEHLAGLSHLKYLKLANTRVTEEGCKTIAQLSNLETLDLSGTKVTDAGLAHLRTLQRLRKLKLEDTSIARAGIEHIASLTRLEQLDLSGTRIVSADLAPLARLEHLHYLSLEDTPISDAAVPYLIQFRNLDWLWITHTPVAGTSIIQVPLSTLDNECEPSASGAVSGIAELRKMSRLPYLHVAEQGLSARGLEAVQKAFPNCRIVNIEWETRNIRLPN